MSFISAIRMAGHCPIMVLQISARAPVRGHFSFIAQLHLVEVDERRRRPVQLLEPTGLNGGPFPTTAATSTGRWPSSTGRTASRAPSSTARAVRAGSRVSFNPIVTAATACLPPSTRTISTRPPPSSGRTSSPIPVLLPATAPNGMAVQYLAPASAASFPLGPVGRCSPALGHENAGAARRHWHLGATASATPGEFDVDLRGRPQFSIREHLKLQFARRSVQPS